MMTRPTPSLVDRRRLLQTLGGIGLGSSLCLSSWPTLSWARSPIAPRRPIESCILIMYYGGPSHLDTWDMKPEATAEVRGEFRPISTSVPGQFVCEHLPLTSQIVDRLAVIRSMHHPMTNHNSAMYESLIGRLPSGGDIDVLGANRLSDFPNHGAVLSYLTEQGKLAQQPQMPLVNVALPHVMHNVVDLAGQNAGFLGASYDPFQIEQEPNVEQFDIESLKVPGGVTGERQTSRRSLLETLDQQTAEMFVNDDIEANRERAFQLIGRQKVQSAFQIGKEPDAVRDRYGRHRLGQSMLMARRLVEAGVRFINVNDKIYNGQLANWDSHQNNFGRHRELLPPADQAFSALIQDLEQRGLLDTTLVIAMGEFGRTPKINGTAGRDHWPDCYSVVLAGGGVIGGSTLGTSDRIGAYPATHPVTPGDLAATIFWRFGLDHRHEIYDALERPFPLADGEPMSGLFV